jgi:uncharacterized membrane protein YhaH (DUF805 family)
MSWGQLLFSFRGRVNRTVFWLFGVVLLVLFGLLECIAVMSGEKAQAGMGIVDLVTALFWLLVVWPSLAVTAKRWHDVDMSGWWMLLGAIPFVGGLIAVAFTGFVPGTPGANRFGQPC